MIHRYYGMKKIVVIGGGPAGMMAAISAASSGAKVTLIEKNEKLGKKLYITGKGRCNLTNACDPSGVFDNIVNNPKFMFSALNAFSNKDTAVFFEKAGLELKEERGMRIFPASDKASDVTKTLERELRKAGVVIKLNTVVKKIEFLSCVDKKTTDCLREEKKCVKITTAPGKDTELICDAVIVATGGISYASTGSTGDGYVFAENAGHRISEPHPALVPLVFKESYAGELEGLSLRNIKITVSDEKNKKIYEDFGEMVFTKRGASGPVILSASSYLTRHLPVKDPDITGQPCGKIKDEGSRKAQETGDPAVFVPGHMYSLAIDLKPALSEEQLDERILRDFAESINKAFKNSLNKLLPKKLIPVAVRLSDIDPEKKVNGITKAERENLVKILKAFTFTIEGTEPFNQAIVTSGGVNVKEINPKTMQSKLEPQLYFAGEVLDVDALTGGFNIQIALSTGWLAGQSAAHNTH